MEKAIDHGLDEVIPRASPGLLEHIPLHEELDEMRKKNDGQRPCRHEIDPSAAQKHP